MTITVHPITPDFAAEVGDVVLGKPLAADDLAAIRAAFTKYAVLVFPDQEFDDESQLDFARHFGPLETTVFKARKDHKLRLHENMADVGNLDAENRILETNDRQRLYNLGNRLWHTDASFQEIKDAGVTILSEPSDFKNIRIAFFSDPDGNSWLLQEITSRLSGRVDPGAISFGSISDLSSAFRRAEAAHGEHEKRTGGQRDENWPDWYAKYMAAEQTGEELPQ